MDTHHTLNAAELEPGDVLTDEPGTFTVAAVELPTPPAVVATIRSASGGVRYCGIGAVLPVRRSPPDLDPRAAFDAGGADVGHVLTTAPTMAQERLEPAGPV